MLFNILRHLTVYCLLFFSFNVYSQDLHTSACDASNSLSPLTLSHIDID